MTQDEIYTHIYNEYTPPPILHFLACALRKNPNEPHIKAQMRYYMELLNINDENYILDDGTVLQSHPREGEKYTGDVIYIDGFEIYRMILGNDIYNELYCNMEEKDDHLIYG